MICYDIKYNLTLELMMYSYIRKVGGFGFIAMIMICVFLSQISFASTTANKKDSEAISNASIIILRSS